MSHANCSAICLCLRNLSAAYFPNTQGYFMLVTQNFFNKKLEVIHFVAAVIPFSKNPPSSLYPAEQAVLLEIK